jgi:hypothetical protein
MNNTGSARVLWRSLQGGTEIDRVGLSLDSVFIFLGISVAPKVPPVFEMLGNHSAFPREND